MRPITGLPVRTVQLDYAKQYSLNRIILLTGAAFFMYSLLVGAAIQLYLVPVAFPRFNLGDGLAILDSQGFHSLAKAKAGEIIASGWGAWEFRPNDHLPVGIASIFYVLWTPNPYSLLPFNALVHAASGCLVLGILGRFFSTRAAIIGSTLFVINPAAMEWVSQIHKDGVFILGNLSFLYGILLLVPGEVQAKVSCLLKGGGAIFIGTMLAWAARPFWSQVFFIFLIAWMVALLLFNRKCWAKNNTRQFAWVAGIVLGVLVFQVWLIKYHGITLGSELSGTLEGGVYETGWHGEKSQGRMSSVFVWQRTQGLPEIVEQKLYQMASARRGAINTGGNTLVDADVPFDSFPAFLGYFPRALQLGLLSPLPGLWSGEGSTPAMTLARKIMGGVTLVFYASLLACVVFFIKHWRDWRSWTILGFCLFCILLYTYTYPNIGTLMRYRYGFYMLLISIGGALLAERMIAWLGGRKTASP